VKQLKDRSKKYCLITFLIAEDNFEVGDVNDKEESIYEILK
jgi:hypothetical protein